MTTENREPAIEQWAPAHELIGVGNTRLHWFNSEGGTAVPVVVVELALGLVGSLVPGLADPQARVHARLALPVPVAKQILEGVAHSIQQLESA